jgi:HAD superfamily hydrolase (TIGR01549 family)
VTPRPARLAGPPVRAVLFDYGRTLVTFSRPGNALLEAYGQVEALLRRRLPAGVRVPDAADLIRGVHDHVDTAVADHDATATLDEIRLEPVYRDAYARLCGVVLGDDLLDEVIRLEQRAWFDGVRPVPDAIPTLRTLRTAGLRVGLCSNAPYDAAVLREQLDHVGLASLLDAVTLSSDAGRRKPAPELFRQALADLGVVAGDAVHVGDRLREDVGGARAAGLRGVWLAPDTGVEGGAIEADAVIDSVADIVPLILGAGRR